MRFHLATPEEIRQGKVTDVYFVRTLEVLRAEGRDPWVAAEVWTKDLPRGWPWAVWAGLEEALALLEGRPLNVRALPEGTVFRPLQPVLEVEGRYSAFALLETALLGVLCQASGVATAAARCRRAAGGRLLLSFGARRMHPAISPMIERSAFIGGCDGVAVVKSAELLGQQAAGTMPHALVLIMGDTLEAARAFHRHLPPEVPRVVLVDTFQDEKFESLRVAEALGEALYGVRLDTPSTRRGDFLQILREVRWELDLRGFRGVKLLVSGGITEQEILRLNEVVDGYGVGTFISNAPVVDFSLDIVEVEGRPVAKRGKPSGRKQLWRCPACGRDLVLPLGQEPPPCGCGQRLRPLLTPLLRDGSLVGELPSPQEIRSHVLEQLEHLSL